MGTLNLQTLSPKPSTSLRNTPTPYHRVQVKQSLGLRGFRFLLAKSLGLSALSLPVEDEIRSWERLKRTLGCLAVFFFTGLGV